MTPEQETFVKSLDQDGLATPEDVLAAAESEDSPIHSLFTWDDTVAGHKYRLNEARTTITRVRIRTSHHVRELRQPVYVRNPELPAKEGGYIRVSLLKTREEGARMALQAEIDRVSSLVARTRTIAAGLGLADECETQLREIVAGASVALAS